MNCTKGHRKVKKTGHKVRKNPAHATTRQKPRPNNKKQRLSVSSPFVRGTPLNERGEIILNNGVECSNGTSFDLVLPDGPFTNDVRGKEENENVECVFSNDRI